MIKIFKATTVNQEILESVNFLLPQLSQSAKSIQIDQLNNIINSDCTSLIFAKDEEKIIGMLSFCSLSNSNGKKRGLKMLLFINPLVERELGNY